VGIIQKQTIRGSFWSYLGVIIGFITTSYLYPKFLTTEIVGLFGLLIAISNITSQIASLGINGVTARLFPHFRSPENRHHGYLFFSLITQLIGFLIFVLIYFLIKNKLIENNLEKSTLFASYAYLIVIITFFFIVFNFFDTYIKVLYNAVIGTFLQEFFQRVLILIAVILFIFSLIDLNQLIIAFALAVSFKGILIFLYLLDKGEINLKPGRGFIKKPLRKEIADVALFSIIGGLGSMIVFQIDKIVINQMLDLSNTGVYTIAFYFGTLVVIPSRPLLKIAGTLIADAWAKNDTEKVKEIYYKSCINQFIIGGFLFLGIWANIDNILNILGTDYLQSKWVIFFIGIGYLFDMMTGANGHVIAFSKSYRVALWFILILVVLVVVLLYSLIPVWGITGAAVAIAIALFLNNLMRHLFLFRKYKMQPFNFTYLWVALFYTGLYFLLKLLPQQALIIDIVIRGAIITFATGVLIIFVPLSEDLHRLVNKILRLKVY
jgi:O-antigen/teichoic acid export membrane protein